MAYFRGQEIGDAVISHHLYEHNIFVKLYAHSDGMVIKVLSGEAEPFTFNNFLTKIGTSIENPTPVIPIYHSQYNINGVFFAEEGQTNIRVLYYEEGYVKIDSDTCLATNFKDTVKQIF